MSAAGGHFQPGRIRSLDYLGQVDPGNERELPYAAYFLTYESRASGGSVIAAKLSIPLGEAPQAGWPVSLWCHGFGDPGSDFYQWPFMGNRWRRSRGELATRWAACGIATLAPWLPGAGPSEPIGTFSPFSLERNARAVNDGLTAIRNIPSLLAKTEPSSSLRFDEQPILRADCASSALLVYLASQSDNVGTDLELKALVADNFQPSIAYFVSYLDPFIRKLPSLPAAQSYCVWWRVLWSLASVQGFPIARVLSDEAIELFSRPMVTTAGQFPYIVGQRFFPLDDNALARAVVSRQTSKTADGNTVARWAFSTEFYAWASSGSLAALIRHPFYQELFAVSDPFFAETITPFSPGAPLLVIPRTGQQTRYAGMPDFDAQFQNMTKPKIDTLQSWGWNVDVCPMAQRRGTSFGTGRAREWALNRLKCSS